MDVVLKKCALCENRTDMRQSHIVPRFVYRHMKATAPGRLRSTERPNVVVQDGEKHYLLCSACEEKFSAFEKCFADNMFYPYMKESKRVFNYDTWLSDFITSISWRCLYLDLMDFVQNQVVGLDALETFIASEKIMHDYLLSNRNDIGNIEHHIFFFDDIESASDDLLTLDPHTNIHRSICCYTVASEEARTYFTITNILGIIIVTIYSKSENEEWINTRIVSGKGAISSKNQQVKSVVGEELLYIMRTAQQGKLVISDKQQETINVRLDKARNSGIIYPVFQDVEKDRVLRQQAGKKDVLSHIRPAPNTPR